METFLQDWVQWHRAQQQFKHGHMQTSNQNIQTIKIYQLVFKITKKYPTIKIIMVSDTKSHFEWMQFSFHDSQPYLIKTNSMKLFKGVVWHWGVDTLTHGYYRTPALALLRTTSVTRWGCCQSQSRSPPLLL